MTGPEKGELYRHFKGGLYRVITVAQHTETSEGMVIYASEEDPSKVWARPIASFLSPVDRVKYPDATQEMRFERVDDSAQAADAGSYKDASTVSYASDPLGDRLDPEVEEFLDAKTASDRLNILASLNHRLTDDMLVIMSTACGVELPEGDVRQKYLSLRDSLIIMGKYEGNRLRR